MPVTSRKHPASSLLNAEAHQSTASVGSISLPRVLRLATPSSKLLHSQVQGLRGGIAAQERSHASTEPLNISQATRLSTVKLSTANADRPQQRWTRQLLRGSELLPRPSTVKLAIFPLASAASLRLAFYARKRLVFYARRRRPSLKPGPDRKCTGSTPEVVNY